MENGIYDDNLNNPLNNPRYRRRRSTPVSPLMRGVLLILRTLLLLCSLYILWLFVFWFVRRGRRSSALAVLILSAVSAGWSIISLWTTCFGHQNLAIFMVVVDLLGMAVMIAVTILLRGYVSNNCPASRRDCNLLWAAFGIAIGTAVLYAVSGLLSLHLLSVFVRARPFGPSPDNDYHVGYNKEPKRRGYISPELGQSGADPAYTNTTSSTADGFTSRPMATYQQYRGPTPVPVTQTDGPHTDGASDAHVGMPAESEYGGRSSVNMHGAN